MELQGKWIGWYAYSDEKITKVRGIDRTVFYINIDTVNANKFSGTVQDDKTTLGMEGVGSIEGKTVENTIHFIKKMPFKTSLLKDERIVEKSKRHPKIYYTGTAVGNDCYRGIWKLRFSLTFIGMRLAIVFPIKGTWEMKRTTNPTD